MTDTTTAAPETGAATEEKEATAKRLTPAEWAEICRLWELGECNLADLSRTYGVTQQAISAYFKRHNIKKGSKAEEVKKAVVAATTAATTATVTKRVLSFHEQKAERTERTKNQSYQALEAIAQMQVGILAKIAKGDPASKYLDDVKTLRLSAQNITITMDGRYKLLEIDSTYDKEALPEIVIRDMTEDDLAKIRAQDDELSEIIGETEKKDDEDDDLVVEGEDG